ncbi:MAG: hypothetical protein RR495_00875 [Anaerovoracaceae bacterium]
MELKRLLEILQIEEPSEFEFFENFADLVESDEEISDDELFLLFKETDHEIVAEIIKNYFDEVLDAMPDDKTDMYTLLETIKMSLVGLIISDEGDSTLVHFCEELNRFKEWYSVTSKVEVKTIDNSQVEELTIRDALVVSRLEALEGNQHHYDFEACLEYELDEFIVNYADIANAEYNDSYEGDSLIDSGYVYDDEMRGN